MSTAETLTDGLMEIQLEKGWFLYRLEHDGAIAEQAFKGKQEPIRIKKLLMDEIIKFRSIPQLEREQLEKMKKENNAVDKDKGVG
ncbi:MAG: hypothetical protein ACREAE_01935 [Nitrosopumilaceae archaeon]